MKRRYLATLVIIAMLATVFSGCMGEEKVPTTTIAPTTAPPTTTPAPTYEPPEIKEYDIQFTAKYVGGRNFKISGTTNLPNGAKIWVTIYDEDYFEHDDDDPDWRMENLTYFAGSVLVRDGKFTKTLTASELEAPLKLDKYEVEVCFNPRAQTESIKRIVGEDGEYLGGRLVNNEIEGLTTLETSTIIALTLSTPTTTPVPTTAAPTYGLTNVEVRGVTVDKETYKIGEIIFVRFELYNSGREGKWTAEYRLTEPADYGTYSCNYSLTWPKIEHGLTTTHGVEFKGGMDLPGEYIFEIGGHKVTFYVGSTLTPLPKDDEYFEKLFENRVIDTVREGTGRTIEISASVSRSEATDVVSLIVGIGVRYSDEDLGYIIGATLGAYRAILDEGADINILFGAGTISGSSFSYSCYDYWTKYTSEEMVRRVLDTLKEL